MPQKRYRAGNESRKNESQRDLLPLSSYIGGGGCMKSSSLELQLVRKTKGQVMDISRRFPHRFKP